MSNNIDSIDSKIINFKCLSINAKKKCKFHSTREKKLESIEEN